MDPGLRLRVFERLALADPELRLRVFESLALAVLLQDKSLSLFSSALRDHHRHAPGTPAPLGLEVGRSLQVGAEPSALYFLALAAEALLARVVVGHASSSSSSSQKKRRRGKKGGDRVAQSPSSPSGATSNGSSELDVSAEATALCRLLPALVKHSPGLGRGGEARSVAGAGGGRGGGRQQLCLLSSSAIEQIFALACECKDFDLKRNGKGWKRRQRGSR